LYSPGPGVYNFLGPVMSGLTLEPNPNLGAEVLTVSELLTYWPGPGTLFRFCDRLPFSLIPIEKLAAVFLVILSVGL